MNSIETIIPVVIGGTVAWFVLLGIRELFKETFDAFNRKSAA